MEFLLRFIFIAAIILGVLFFTNQLKRDQLFKTELDEEKQFSGNLKKELDEIRERLANLEKIVTDKGYRVKDEIDQL